MKPINRFQTIIYLGAICVAWAMLSDMDYAEARRQECGNRSTSKYLVEWDSNLDRCIKGVRNGTTAQNR